MNTKSITVRVPLDMLEQIESLASERYPHGRQGEPDRSKMMLDLLRVALQNWDVSHTITKQPDSRVLQTEDTVRLNHALLDEDTVRRMLTDILQSNDNVGQIIDGRIEVAIQRQMEDTLGELAA